MRAALRTSSTTKSASKRDRRGRLKNVRKLSPKGTRDEHYLGGEVQLCALQSTLEAFLRRGVSDTEQYSS